MDNVGSVSISRPLSLTRYTRYRVLVGAILVQLILGTVYGYSIFWTPLDAKVFPPVITRAERVQRIVKGEDVSGFTVVEDKEAAEKRLALQQGYLKYAFSICILTFAVVMVIAGRIQDVKGPRFPAVVGAVLMGLGFITAGLMDSPIVFYIAHSAFAGLVVIVLLMLYHTLFGRLDKEERAITRHVPNGIMASVIVAAVVLGQQYVGKMGEWDKLFLLWGTVGFLAGAGIGFAYVCPIAALVKWFPQHKGLVSGLAVAGFGFGAYLFKDERFGALGFIREHDITSFFVVHGALCLVAVTLGAMMLCNPPATDKPTGPAAPAESPWQETLRKPAFYMLWLMFFSGAMAGLMVIGIVSPFVTDQLLSAKLNATEATAAGAAAVGFLAIFNALGRIVWGLVSDRIGRTAAFVAMFVLQAATMFLLGALDTRVALWVGASIVGFNFGGNFALFPSATADLFGAKNLGANYGWVFTSYGIAGVMGIVAGNAAKVTTGSYAAAFAIAGALCLVSAGLAIGLRFVHQKVPVDEVSHT